MKNQPEPDSDLILYQTEDGRTRIQCRFENETVWLTQQQMAELFQTTQQNVSLHVRNIYEEGELSEEATHKESLSVRQEGARSVQRRVEFYNLDVIISVGYRVKSQRGTQFRIWATQRLREYLHDHPSISNREVRELLGLGESPTAQVEASRYLKKWSGPSGFLTADGNGAKRCYRLKEAS